MAKPHILVVEDETHLAVGIKFNLEREGYRVTTVGDGPTALISLDTDHDPVDLMILDLMLPQMSGYAVCEHLRKQGRNIPVLILSARTLTEDRIRGFDVGANQYLTKPFDLDELLSRVRNLLHFRQTSNKDAARQEEPEEFAFDEAQINFRTFEVNVRGKSARLTSLEIRLLQYFVVHRGRVITRNELLENVWNTSSQVTTRAVDQFIMRLRKTFEPDPANPRYFLTVRDAGYRFSETGQDGV
jgi:two-component system OmpR family response regulator